MPRPKKRVNKMEAVREALNKLGKDAMPLDLQKAVKDSHGVSLSTSLISNYKSYLLKKGIRRAGRKEAAAHANGTSAGISLADIEAVKHLTDRLGAQKVVQLAKVLGK